MIDERIEEQAAAYALGALSAEEVRAFEAQLASDPELRQVVAQLREAAGALAGDAPGVVPPDEVRARVLRDLAEPEPLTRTAAVPQQRRLSQRWMPWALAAALAVLAAFLAWQMDAARLRLGNELARVDELRTTVDALRAQDADLRRTVQRLQESNRLANVRIALLSSLLKSAPQALAVSVWDNERQSGVFIVRGLSPAPPGKDYQLWIIDPRYPMPVDAGVFRVDAQGQVREEFRARMPIQTANQFAVTEERQGGSPVPTLKAMVLAGS